MARPRLPVPIMTIALVFSVLAVDVEEMVKAVEYGRAYGTLGAHVLGFGGCVAASNFCVYRFFRVLDVLTLANREGRSSDARRSIRPLLVHATGASLPMAVLFAYIALH